MPRHDRLSSWMLLLGSVSTLIATARTYTTTHEEGRCAIRGQCGKQSFFGGELPCADNGEAEDLEADVRKKLVSVCGDKWSKGPVCCLEDQIDALTSNLQRAETFIASCPACKENFYNLFCTFTCSPNQSTFVNVTETAEKNNKLQVTSLDTLWSDEYGSGFFNSCKEVKFGATNTPAMNFIGGGAKNFTEFLAFLGKKNPPFGSPFQINFPRLDDQNFTKMAPANETASPCNSTDTNLKCPCVDCSGSCPQLPEISETKNCHVGAWPCLSFASILVYAFLLSLLITAIVGKNFFKKRAQNRNDRLRLLQDTSLSDDEDDEDDEDSYRRAPSMNPTRKYWLNTICDRLFSSFGRKCARYPAMTIGISLIAVVLLSLGWLRFEVERDPVRLWVAPNSAAAQEKAFFDDNFGPFFRAEQAFLVNDTNESGPGPVLSYDTLSWWFDVEARVERLKSRHAAASLNDVCYKPTGEDCVVQSVTGYFGGDFSTVDPTTWPKDLERCTANPSECRPAFGLPIEPKLVLGGYNESVVDAEAIIVTWVVNNHADDTDELERAKDWEQSMKSLLRHIQYEAKERGLRLSFNTEISLEQELNKSSNTDARIVVVSYIVMFLYVSLALGSTTLAVRHVLRNPSSALVQSKFMLGVAGIVIVLFSVSASVGLFSAMGVKVTLIIAEVIPFLVLAIGVDNIFLIVHEFERINVNFPRNSIDDRMAKTMGRVGPSILLSATMETVAFALGAFVGMPAVRNFAAYAAGAVVINALLQLTMFVATLALNQRRVEAGRSDCVPCLQVRPAVGIYEDSTPEDDELQRFIRRTYAPALLTREAKIVICTVFMGLFALGIALLPTVQLGLDQRIAIPGDSYLIPYFNDLYDYFDAGPPVYFVSRNLNVTERDHQQQLCGRFSTCNELSLANTLEQERKRSSVSTIADPAASWVDDFFLWLNPALGDGGCVNPRTQEPCFANRSPPYNITLSGMPEGDEYLAYLRRWLAAPTDEDHPLGGKAAYSSAVVLPPEDTNHPTIPASHFRTSHIPLRSQSDLISSYSNARRIASSINEANPGLDIFPYSKHYVFFDQYLSIVGLSITLIAAALIACFLISALLLGSIQTGLVVTLTVTMTLVDIAGAMSLFHVSLNAVTLVNLIICVGIAVEFCAHIARAFQFPSPRLLADAARAAATTPTSATFGSGFSLLSPAANNDGTTDATSNSSGNTGSRKASAPTFGRLPSSFSAARAVSNPSSSAALSGTAAASTRDARAWAALTQVGASVFSGITVTKVLGVSVLAFTRSRIFEVYYFRVWACLVVLAALHALVFLPVALSLVGGREGWKGEGEGERGGVEEDLRGRVRGAGVGGDGYGYGDGDDDSDYEY